MYCFFFFLMQRRPPRSTQSRSSAASDVYKRQVRKLAERATQSADEIRALIREVQNGVAEAVECQRAGTREVAEGHDASARGEIIQTENLGFCAAGDGGPCAERGETALGGRVPINPSGGLESKGHPIGATGLGQIHELVVQLRHAAGPRARLVRQ